MTLPQMERRGLIERRGDSRDKRVLRLYLTNEGKTLAERAMQIQTALIDRILSATPVEECVTIGSNMERMIAVLQAESAGDADQD
jgi:DNA-binding MarR family transcriptional regulator